MYTIHYVKDKEQDVLGAGPIAEFHYLGFN